MSSTKTTPLHKVTDDNLWDAAAAECPFRRLCIVVHAAFIDAGFLPVGAPPPATTRSLSRSYSLPQRPGEDLVALRLCRRPRRRGDRTRTVLHICAQNNTSPAAAAAGGRLERRERLDEDAAAAALSGGLDETARALRAPDSAAQRLWKLLADGLCRGLFLDACRASGVPVEPGFGSLPGDVKALILSRLGSGRDVAMAECASRELRDLAAEHDADVWEPKCDNLDQLCLIYDSWGSDLESWRRSLREALPNMTWKQRYMVITQPPPARPLAEPVVPRAPREVERAAAAAAANSVAAEIRALVNVAANVPGKDASGGADSVVRCNGYGHRRRHGAGVIQSPSSRYRWRHR